MGFRSRLVEFDLVNSPPTVYVLSGFGRAENRSWREPGEESPNTTGRDAA